MFHPDTTIMASLFGGAMIGLSAVLLMAFTGRIAGIAGLTSALLPPAADKATLERLAFLGGIIAAPLLYTLATGSPAAMEAAGAPVLLIIAGAITGFGAVWGYGCTSGHGVCGLSRLSPRSAVAVASFMATAMLTVFVTRHLIG